LIILLPRFQWDPEGLSPASEKMLGDAKAKGVKVHSANLMVMYFGEKIYPQRKIRRRTGHRAAIKACQQLQKIDPNIQVGLCPCPGQTVPRLEVFTLQDAHILRAFAPKTPWVCSLHCLVNQPRRRISKKEPATDDSTNTLPALAFANVFKSFTSSSND